MAAEADLQAKITKYLRSKGCYVIKTTASPGVPRGCPDIIAFYDGCVIIIEVKASAKARFQPLQKTTLDKLEDWFKFVYVVHPDNWDEVKAELSKCVFL